MIAKQISVFLENKQGRLAQLTTIISNAGININALTIADTSDFGILRLIVDETERTYDLLKEKGFSVSVTDVVALDIVDEPGGIALPLNLLHQNGVSVEYVYAFLAKKDNTAHVIFKVDNVDTALNILKGNGYKNTAKV